MLKISVIFSLILISFSSVFSQTDHYKLSKACFNSKYDDFGVRKLNGVYYLISASIDKDSSVRIDEYTGKPITDLYELNDCYRKDAYFKNAKTQENWLLSSINYDGPIAPNRYGNIVFFSHNNEVLGSKMGIYYLVKEGNAWSDAIAFPFNSNSYNIVHPFFEEQTNKLYFASDMKGGNFDLFFVTFDGNSFGAIESVQLANSPKNEFFPCSINGELFFTSDRDGGLGQFDIYHIKNNQVDNLGPQVNSEYDEVDIVFINDFSGFISSNRESNGNNDDSYFFIRTRDSQYDVKSDALSDLNMLSKVDKSQNTLNLLEKSEVSNMMLDLSKITLSDVINKSKKIDQELTQNTIEVFKKLNSFSDSLKEQILNNIIANYNSKMSAISEMNRIIDELKTERDSAKIESLLKSLEEVMNEISPELIEQNKIQTKDIRQNLMTRLKLLNEQEISDNKLSELSKVIFAEVISLPENEKNNQLKNQMMTEVYNNLRSDAIAFFQLKLNSNLIQKNELENKLSDLIEEYIEKGLVKNHIEFKKIDNLVNKLSLTNDPDEREKLLQEISELSKQYAPDLHETIKETLAFLNENNSVTKKIISDLNETEKKYTSFKEAFAQLSNNVSNLNKDLLNEEILKLKHQFGIDVSKVFYPDLPNLSPELLREFIDKYQPQNILFAFDSYQLKNEYHKELDDLIRFINRYRQFQIYLDGHTDIIGRLQYNLNLSKNRANSVKKYLVNNGINELAFVTTPHGPAIPVASNKDKEGRRLNRRVEIRLVIQ